MNLAVIRGQLSRDPELRELRSGTSVANFDVTVRDDRAPAASVPVAWIDPPPTWETMAAGDEVVVCGPVRRRFFRTADGTASRTEVVADRVIPARQAKRVRAALDTAAAAIRTVSG